MMKTWLPRIFILFKSEDPFLFAKRVAAAIKARKEAEGHMVSFPISIYNLTFNPTYNTPVQG